MACPERTRGGESRQHPRPEHPDPFFARQDWLSLNGEWDFACSRRAAPGPGSDAKPKGGSPPDGRYPHRIVVPFPTESEAAGLPARARRGARELWYRRTFRLPDDWAGHEVLLRIGAADYRCEGFVNGHPVGAHDGGFAPMSWPVGRFLSAGDNEIVLHVRETTDPRLPRGKQSHLPFAHTIFYPPFSGIWQPVWLERAGAAFIISAAALPLPDRSGFELSAQVSDRLGQSTSPSPLTLCVHLTAPDAASEAEARVPVLAGNVAVLLIPRRRFEWSPASPVLYGLRIDLMCDERVLDSVESCAGLRSVRVSGGRFRLNDRPCTLKLALYQPYYPDGWAAAVRDEDFLQDVKLALSFGFNGLRVHQSQADPRLLYWCDRMGLLVWSEMPSAFPFSRVSRPAFTRMLEECIARDCGHPSIVAWVLFNESWGIADVPRNHDTQTWVRQMATLCRSLDPSRPLVDNSGFDHVETDIVDVHHYLAAPERVRHLYAALVNPASIAHRWWRSLYAVLPSRVVRAPLVPGVQYSGQPVMVSECGGFGFGPYSTSSMTLLDSLRQVVSALADHPHIAGFCYTQLFDVAQERNGLADFHRRPKIAPETVRELLDSLSH